jgi:predicted RNA-binding Zn-ribbon protein involved in translation (DUF1610 family)
MKQCSKCGKIIGYNARFNKYICRTCGNVEVESPQRRLISVVHCRQAKRVCATNEGKVTEREKVLVGTKA